MKKKLYIAILVLFFVYGCRKILQCDKKEKLTFVKKSYHGNELNTNGYYYYFNSVNSYCPIILYRDGIISSKFQYAFDTSRVDEFENELADGTYYQSVKNNKYSWGLYYINGNEIKYEIFDSYGSTSCFFPIIITGEIVNDTTILFTSESSIEKSENINQLYRFKKFSPKPDSINSFIP